MKLPMNKADLLRSTIFAGLTVSLMAGMPVWAQDADGDGAATAQPEEDTKKKTRVRDNIIVTGSRIRRDEFSAPVPILVITNDQAALSGLLTTTEILQTSPIAAGQQIDDSFSGFVTDGGAGANTLSLRGLGAQRTLILVNGKRWVASGVQGSVNSVDLSAIPTSIWGRVEILKDGASSVYGADAVAGVVNLLTKETLDGFQVNFAGSTFTDVDSNANYSLNASYGKVADNWSFSVSGDYSANDSIVRSDLGAPNDNYAFCDRRRRFTDQDGNGTIDNRDPNTGDELCFGFIYGLVTSPFGFARYEPSLATNDPANPAFDGTINGAFGIPFYTRNPENGNDANGNPIFDNEGAFYRDNQEWDIAQMRTKGTRYSLTSFGQYDFNLEGRDATAYYEAYFNRRETEAVSGFRQIFPTVGATNPTNPFGTNGPLAGFGGFAVRPVMPSYNLLDPTSRVDVDRYNLFAGLKGDVNDKWSYDAYMGIGGSVGTYAQEQILQDRISFALGNDIVTGNPNGATPCTALPGQVVPTSLSNGCVALDLFTEDALLRGILPQNALDYIVADTEGSTTYRGVTFAANVSGELFEAPAGTVQAVFGVEVRRESINDVPDINAQNDNYFGFASSGITAGSDVTKEAFTEIEIPIVRGKLFFEDLTLNLAGRYTDYRSYGDGTTYRVAGNWQITPEYKVRASFGTSFRAPDLFEQFLGNSTGFTSGFADPCLNFGQGGLVAGDILFDNCVALGLDPATFGNGAAPSIRTVTGGNPELLAEDSDSLTIGVIWQPDWIGLSIGVDYFDIEVRDTVANPSVGFILGDCLVRTRQTSAFCARVGARDTFGNLTDIDTSLLNVGAQGTKGYDVNFKYDKEFSFGDLNVNGQMTYVDSQTLDLLGSFFEFKGNYGNPEISGNLETNFDWEDFRFTWTMNYIGETEDPNPGRDPAPVGSPAGTLGPIDRPFQTESIVYHSLGVRYRANDLDVIVAVNNLFNELPPVVGGSTNSATSVFNTIPGAGYSLFGRAATIRISKRF